MNTPSILCILGMLPTLLDRCFTPSLDVSCGGFCSDRGDSQSCVSTPCRSGLEAGAPFRRQHAAADPLCGQCCHKPESMLLMQASKTDRYLQIPSGQFLPDCCLELCCSSWSVEPGLGLAKDLGASRSSFWKTVDSSSCHALAVLAPQTILQESAL